VQVGDRVKYTDEFVAATKAFPMGLHIVAAQRRGTIQVMKELYPTDRWSAAAVAMARPPMLSLLLADTQVLWDGETSPVGVCTEYLEVLERIQDVQLTLDL
jgi:hypothetical protein